jgi:hypothetical protein
VEQCVKGPEAENNLLYLKNKTNVNNNIIYRRMEQHSIRMENYTGTPGRTSVR